ncbi:MAG: hypothetical protein VKK07_07150 [Merismopediaceae bacterium]|nr:hypothetical protein [Merismopediaceae bacterium]
MKYQVWGIVVGVAQKLPLNYPLRFVPVNQDLDLIQGQELQLEELETEDVCV